MSLLPLDHGPFAASLSPRGGAIWSFTFESEGRSIPLLVPRGNPQQDKAGVSGCFPLVPFGNRVRNNSFTFQGMQHEFCANTADDPHYLHGDGWLETWDVEEQTTHSARLVLRHARSSASPYAYTAIQTVSLEDDGMHLTLSLTNEGTEPLPFGLGWHPFFPRTKQTRLYAPASHHWAEDNHFLPTMRLDLPPHLDFSCHSQLPKGWTNSGFEGWNGEAELVWPEEGIALGISASDPLRCYFLFMPDTTFDPAYREDYVCLEPMSHVADAHNMADLGGLVPLAHGETLAAHISFSVRML